MISNQNKLMLKILSNSLHKIKSEPIGMSDWTAVSKELIDQSVLAITSDSINLEKTDENEKILNLQKTTRTIQIFNKIMTEQSKIFQLLNEANIDTVVLKGAAAAIYYPNPSLRCMGDIDIIVNQKDFEKAFHILCESGYTNIDTLDHYDRHICFKSKKGIEIELHNYFSTSRNKKQNEILDRFVFKGISNAETKKIGKNEFKMLPKLENGLVLLSHINQHLSSGLGLRQIIDWMCYVEKNLDNEFWKNEFSKAADSIGMKTLAKATTAMCKKYLDLNSDITWADDLDNMEICDELMEYILNHGNFGRKEAASTNTVSVLRAMKNPFKGIAYLQKTGCYTWKALKKHKWLKPFAWIYQIFRWINHGKKGGVTLSSAKESAIKEQNETNLMKKLGITKI